MKTLLLIAIASVNLFGQSWQVKFSDANFSAVAMRWSNQPGLGLPAPGVAREDGAMLMIDLTTPEAASSRDAVVMIMFTALDGKSYRRAEVGKVYADPTTKKPRAIVLSKMGKIATITKIEVALVPWANEAIAE